MSSPNDSNPQESRTCTGCGETKPLASFYRNHGACRACVQPRSHATLDTVEQQAENRRREKLLMIELKKIAKERLQVKKAVRRQKARDKITKVAAIESGVETDAVTKELAKRVLARRRLIEFVSQMHPRYKAGWVHHDICARLEQFSKDVADGKSPRLMLLVPPRHGKSQIASKLFPAWHLGHHPHHEFISCSYNVSLAMEFSREARDVIKSSYYQHLFPDTKLNDDIQSAETWKLRSSTGTGAGGYVAAGVGGGITGKGAHILSIDDPIKNAEEAESVDIREKLWGWYQSTAYTRLAPGGGVLIIQTCWHDDDLAGRIIRAMKEDAEFDQFEIVKYPAIAEEDEQYRLKGQALHPERYPLEQLLRIKKTIGPRHWSALYQQDPVGDEGAFFNREMFVYRTQEIDLARVNIVQTWDFAIGEKQHNDWTVGTTIAQDENDNLHVLEQVRIKTNDVAKIADAVIDMFEKHNVTAFGAEDGQIWRAMRETLRKRMVERKIYIPIDDEGFKLQPLKDKQVRARPLQARMQLKKVTFPRGQTWVDDLMKECLRFPGGVHDDTVDSLAWGAVLAARQGPPKPFAVPKNRSEKTVKQKLNEFLRSGSGGNGAMSA